MIRFLISVYACLLALVLILTPTAAWARQVSGEVRGRVLDGADRAPVSGARVEIEGTAIVLRSGSDGGFHVRNLEPRVYRLRVTALGFAPVAREFTVQNARVSEQEIVLTRMATTLATQRVEAARDTAAFNAVSISRTTIEGSGARDVADVLQTVPGVVVTRSGGPGQPSRVSIRGSSSNQVLVLVDGVPVNSAVSGNADLSLLPIENIERVTVLTGAQSARYGPRAMAGVIEIVTRRPRYERSLLVRGGGLGEWGGAASIGVTTPGARLTRGFSLSADHREVQGDFRFEQPAVRGGGIARRDNAQAAITQFVAGGLLEGAQHQLTLRASHGLTRRGMAGSIVQPSLTGRQAFTRSAGGATTNHALGRWSLASTFDVAREAGRFTDHAPPFGQAYADSVTASTFAFTGSATTQWHGVTTAAGTEVRHLEVQSSSLAANAPVGQTLAGGWVNARTERSVSVGAMEWRLNSDAALRADHSSLLAGASWSPRVSARAAHRAFALGVSYGAGFSPPTLADQFFHEGVQVRANPSLRPERTRHDMEVRAGVRDVSRLGALWHAEATAYRADIDGMILWMPDFRFIWSPNNYDVQRRGWDARAGVRIPTWHVEMAGALEQTNVTYAGGVLTGQIAYRPRLTANVQMAAIHGASRAELVTRHVGVRRVVAGSGLNALPAYRMTDLRMSSAVSRAGWTFAPTLSIENLFSRQAAMLVDYPFPTRMWSLSLRIRPQSATLP
ncbi:MAG: TonB-dependent receptor plug domain-containing protein [Gemmatimonadaceae bacterium]|nr:TonB-dependent receptor plug domain-containing protein [Gemmatimonadaceae bacterium]